MVATRTRTSARIVQQKRIKVDKSPPLPTTAELENPDVKVTLVDDAETRIPQFYLMKSEPDSRIEKGKDVKFSIDDLQEVEIEPWDGVRSREASRTMRERMKKGDLIMFYHSNTKVPGIAGIARVHKEGYPDTSAFDPKHPYYDPQSDSQKPKWFRVDVQYVRHLKRFVSLKELRADTSGKLENMVLLRRPQLSVQIVSEVQWNHILQLESTTSAEAADVRQTKTASEERSRDAVNETTTQELDRRTMEEIYDTHGGAD